MTDIKLQPDIKNLADAVCGAYELEKLSFDELVQELNQRGEVALSHFFDGLVSLWEKAEDDEKLFIEDEQE